ncbi:MAG TPA: cytochrome C, partial [Saprospiraceae bacterium]|nr:cytochrome C [Saprospiraceae bacterium]
MKNKNFSDSLGDFVSIVSKAVAIALGTVAIVLINSYTNLTQFLPKADKPTVVTQKFSTSSKEVIAKPILWKAPDIDSIEDDVTRWEIEYGKELIAHTAKYLGPNGNKAKISNGLNCQNCHLDAGTREWGNNYGSVASTYPKFRARSGTEENIYKR